MARKTCSTSTRATNWESKIVPPVLANTQSADDYDLTQGTFIGSRVSAQKHSFDHTGSMNNLDIKQVYHLDVSKININNTFIGLIGGFTPGTRWFWPQGPEGYVEQIAFAPGALKEVSRAVLAAVLPPGHVARTKLGKAYSLLGRRKLAKVLVRPRR